MKDCYASLQPPGISIEQKSYQNFDILYPPWLPKNLGMEKDVTVWWWHRIITWLKSLKHMIISQLWNKCHIVTLYLQILPNSEKFFLSQPKRNTFFDGFKLSLQNLMLWKWKKPQGILFSGNWRKVSQQGCAVQPPFWARKYYWEDSEECSLFSQKY